MTRLFDVARARAGDKGNTSIVTVFPEDPALYDELRRQLTVERVAEHFKNMVSGEITRFEVPSLGALHFVMREALSGGVATSLAIDPHGKSRSSHMLDIYVEISRDQTGSI